MVGSLRGFFALALPEQAVCALREARQRLETRSQRSRVRPRWIGPGNWHVTLKFLGSLDEALTADLGRLLRNAAGKSKPFVTRWTGLSAFPSLQRARVLVAGLSDDRGLIADLAKHLEEGVRAYGIEPENRPFRAHVTVGRLKNPGNVRDLVEGVELDSGDICLNRVHLYASELHPRGAVYRRIDSIELGAPAP